MKTIFELRKFAAILSVVTILGASTGSYATPAAMDKQDTNITAPKKITAAEKKAAKKATTENPKITRKAGELEKTTKGEKTPSKAIKAGDPAVKKSVKNLCHPKTGAFYTRVTNFTPFSSMDACLKSGGTASKR